MCWTSLKYGSQNSSSSTMCSSHSSISANDWRLPSMGGVPSSTTWMPKRLGGEDGLAQVLVAGEQVGGSRFARSRASVSRSSVMSVSTPFCWPWMTRPSRSLSRGSAPMRRWSAVGSPCGPGAPSYQYVRSLGRPRVILDVVAECVVHGCVVAVNVLAVVCPEHDAAGPEEQVACINQQCRSIHGWIIQR